MKNVVKYLASFILLLGTVAMAEDTAPTPNPSPAAPIKSSPACDKIEQACGQAGFMRGLDETSDGKDLDKACMQPLLKGQTVPGVSVDYDVIKQCQADQKKQPSSSGRHHRRG